MVWFQGRFGGDHQRGRSPLNIFPPLGCHNRSVLTLRAQPRFSAGVEVSEGGFAYGRLRDRRTCASTVAIGREAVAPRCGAATAKLAPLAANLISFLASPSFLPERGRRLRRSFRTRSISSSSILWKPSKQAFCQLSLCTLLHLKPTNAPPTASLQAIDFRNSEATAASGSLTRGIYRQRLGAKLTFPAAEPSAAYRTRDPKTG